MGAADDLFAQFSRRVRPTLLILAKEKFDSAKEWLLQAVVSHPFSVDLMSHGASPRLGGSASGTLFGFLGFEAGTDPIEELIELLDERIQFKGMAGTIGKSLAKILVTIPTKDSMKGLQPLEWDDIPWPVMVEQGISGLQFYVNKDNKRSRSEEGIQTEKPVRSGEFQPENYLTPLFAEFKKRLLLGT